jgi:hypothetical protein
MGARSQDNGIRPRGQNLIYPLPKTTTPVGPAQARKRAFLPSPSPSDQTQTHPVDCIVPDPAKDRLSFVPRSEMQRRSIQSVLFRSSHVHEPTLLATSGFRSFRRLDPSFF